MKKLFAFSLCAFASLTAFAATPVVTVDNLANIRIDGINSGAIEDVIANYATRSAAVRTAAADYLDANVSTMTRADALAAIARAEANGVTVPQSTKDKVATEPAVE